MEGNNGGTLNRIEPGESLPGAGRPKGSLNRSTIARKWLQAEEKIKNPITKVDEQLTQEDIMTLALIKKARSGDVNAYKALMDSAHGAPKQLLVGDDDGNGGNAPVTIRLKIA